MHTSMIQTSGSSLESSTGILDTRSIQSWIALVTCGTIYDTGVNLVVNTRVLVWILPVLSFQDILPSSAQAMSLATRWMIVHGPTDLPLDNLFLL